MIRIKLYANLREIAGKEASVAGKEATLKEVLEKLFQQHPALREAILQGSRIREHHNVLLNGRNVAHLKGLKTIVKDGDEISIFPPVAGGQDTPSSRSLAPEHFLLCVGVSSHRYSEGLAGRGVGPEKIRPE